MNIMKKNTGRRMLWNGVLVLSLMAGITGCSDDDNYRGKCTQRSKSEAITSVLAS